MLIGLTGKKQAGKDTAFKRLQRLLGTDRVRRVAFSDKLYQSAAAALGVTVEQLNEWKTDPSVRIVITKTVDEQGYKRIFTLKSLNIREYLQFYGTEAHREVFGDNFWVDQVTPELETHARGDGDDIVVVTDVRFINEAARIYELGGGVVRIVGPDHVEEAGDGHASEVSLPADHVDEYISNRAQDGDFSYLDEQLNKLIADIEEGESFV